MLENRAANFRCSPSEIEKSTAAPISAAHIGAPANAASAVKSIDVNASIRSPNFGAVNRDSLKSQ